MKHILLMWFFLGLCSVSQAQIVTINDKVTDQPMELVTLHSTAPNTYTITNTLGEADISKFKGAAEIIIRRIGYKSETLSFEEIQKSNFIVFLSPSNITMDQVVVSASRWRQTKSDVASRIATVTPQQVEVQNPQTAADLLSLSGEVYVQKSQLGGGSPMIRGFSSNRLLYVVDGVRMNTAIFRSGNLQNVISLDPFAISNTEVLFGPASVIYGSDALGGVMNFNTLTPSLSASEKLLVSGNAVTRYSSSNTENTYHFNVNVGSQKWGSVTSFSNFNYGDLEMGSHGPDEYLRPEYVQRIGGADVVVANNNPKVQRTTGYSQTNLMQKLRYKPSDDWDITYGFHYSETSNYDRYDRLTEYKNGLPKSAQWFYGPQIWAMNNLSISANKSSLLFDEANLRLAHQYFEESRNDRKFNNPQLRSRTEKVNAYSLNLDLLKSITDNQRLFYGIEAVYDDVISDGIGTDITTGLTTDVAPRYPKSTWTSYAVYLNYLTELSSNITLQGGVRYNQFMLDAKFDDTFYQFPFSKANINDGAFTGSVGLIIRPDKSLAISAVLSTGFRSPNVDDAAKVFDSEPGSVVIPNPNLKPEYAYNAELGVNKIVNEVFQFDVTGYFTLLDDALVRRDFTLNGQSQIMYDGQLSQVQAVQNAAKATIYGVQIAAELSLPSGFDVSSHFNIQEGEEELDNGSTSPSRHAAPWFGTTHIEYKANHIKFDLYGIYSREVSNKDLPFDEQGKGYMYATDKNGDPYSPAWFTLNFKTNFQASEMFSFSAGVENITDRRYRPYSSGIVSPGRNLIFSVKATF
ncbi:MAG: TonB-dependent receptor [Balneolaceae bacterium]